MISKQLLHHISMTVADLLGLGYQENQLTDLKRGLLATAKDLGIDETRAGIENWLRNISWTPKEIEILSGHLTVGETYFFREKAMLQVFRDEMIPEIIRQRMGKNQFIRIWSAGCCTGEEPYSLAILLHEAIPDIRNWKITILATDINRTYLTKAQMGRYTSWSFRETPPEVKTRYFSSKDNTWEIDREIKTMVTFAPLNLAEDQYPLMMNNTQNMDIIFCRNVLMYFNPDQIRMVTNRFYKAIVENGWLITSAVELNDDYFRDFTSVRFDQCTVYQKTLKKSQREETVGLSTAKKRHKPIPVISKKEIQHRKPKGTLSQHDFSSKETEISSEETVENLFNQGQYEKCALMCEELFKSKPDHLGILVFLVRSKANLGLSGQARYWAEKMILHDNVNADHFYLYANILLEEDEVETAEQSVKRALFLNPHHLMSHFLMGNIAKRLDKPRVALKHFKNVIDLLGQYQDEDTIPGSDGLTAGRLTKILIKLTGS